MVLGEETEITLVALGRILWKNPAMEVPISNDDITKRLPYFTF